MTTFGQVLALIAGDPAPSAVEQRFATEFRQVDSDEPGLVLGDDGIVYLVKPDGTRAEVGGGQKLDGVLAYISNSVVVNSGSTIPWDSTVFDTGGYLNPATGKFTIPASKLGVWRVETTFRGTRDTTSDQVVSFFDGPLPDTWYLNLIGNGGNSFDTSGVFPMSVPSADVWDMTIAGGGSPTLVGGLIGCRVALTYLGALP